jgi:hypothetical protein
VVSRTLKTELSPRGFPFAANLAAGSLLLRCDYDHAASRRYLFDRPFSKKIVLTKRIQWIEGSTGSPSFDHAWMHKGPPTLAYEPL